MQSGTLLKDEQLTEATAASCYVVRCSKRNGGRIEQDPVTGLPFTAQRLASMKTVTQNSRLKLSIEAP